MRLLSRQQAADLMEVPVGWVDGMLEIGALECHEGVHGEALIDADEIMHKGYIAPRAEAVSLSHVQAMLNKLGIMH
jgi:hypothetical protein